MSKGKVNHIVSIEEILTRLHEENPLTTGERTIRLYSNIQALLKLIRRGYSNILEVNGELLDEIEADSTILVEHL